MAMGMELYIQTWPTLKKSWLRHCVVAKLCDYEQRSLAKTDIWFGMTGGKKTSTGSYAPSVAYELYSDTELTLNVIILIPSD